MNLIRETRGLFLSWSRLERPRQCATGLSSSTRWAVCITSEKQMCIWHLCFSFPKRIQSWELPSTDLRSHLQMLWLDYVSTQTVNTMKSGGLNRFIVGGQAVFKPLRFWLQFFASTKPKCARSPYFLVSLLLHIFLPNWRCFHSPWIWHPPSAHSPNGSGLMFGFVSKVHLNPICTACLWWRHCPLG